MPRVPLSIVPDTPIPAAPPSDYQQIQSSPADFGGLIGAAEQHVGAEGQQAGNNFAQIAEIQQQRFNQTAGDDAMNLFMDQGERLTYGTPGDPTASPGLYNLKGSDALSRGPEVVSSLTQLRGQIKDGLQNDAQKLQFDEQSRRYFQIKSSEISRHLSGQADVYSAGVAEAGITMAARQAANAYNSDDAIMHSLSDAQTRADQVTGLKYGHAPDPALIEQGQVAARTKVVQDTVYGAMAADQPGRAAQVVAKFGSLIDPHVFEELTRATKGAADQAGVAAGIRGTMGRPLDHGPAVPAVPYQPGAILGSTGASPAQYDTFKESVAGIEHARYDQMGGSGDKYAGRYQMGPNEIQETARRLFEKPPTQEEFLSNPDMQERYFEAYTGAHNDQLMQNSPQYRSMSPDQKLSVLGYAHNQGAGGATEWLRTGSVGRDAFGTAGTAYSNAVASNLSGGAQPGLQLASTGGDVSPVGGAVGPSAPGGIQRYPEVYGEEQRRMQMARADAQRAYPNNPRLQKEWVDGVWQELVQTNALQAKDEAARQKALKDGQEAAANTVVTTLLTDPQKFDIGTITNNPTLTYEQKMTLTRFTEEQFRRAGRDDYSGFGPGFTNVYQSIMAPPGDPARLNDVTDIFKHAGPGGDVSLHGVDVLRNIFAASRKSPDQAANHESVLSWIKEGNRRLSFQDLGGLVKLPDPEGQRIINTQFVPQLWKRFSQAQATGDQDAVDKVLNPDSLNKWIDSLRDQKKMAKDRMDASGQLNDTDIERPGAPLPPPPPAPIDKVKSFPLTNAPGMTSPGNLDPWNRPVLHNADGSYSTTSSMSIGTDKGETLIPTVVNGKRLSNEEAIAHFKTSGENLGTFATPEQADDYATKLHNAQASLYDAKGNVLPTINPGQWTSLMSAPPIATTGQPYTHAAWGEVLRRLAADPKNAGPWFDQHFGPAGYNANEIVQRLMTKVDRVPDIPVGTTEFGLAPGYENAPASTRVPSPGMTWNPATRQMEPNR